MDYTGYSKLKKFSYDDIVDVEELNDNADLIDSKFKEIDDTLESIEETISDLKNSTNSGDSTGEDTGTEIPILDHKHSNLELLESISQEDIEKWNESTSQEIVADDIGLEQDDLTGYVYPTLYGVRSSKGIPLSGGSGTSSEYGFKLRNTTGTSAFSVAYGSAAVISYKFSSIDPDGTPTGEGTATYMMNGSLLYNISISQGDNTVDCGPYLISGKINEFILTVTDADGEQKSLVWSINCIEISVTSTFDYTLAYDGDITFKYTAYGDISKTIHFILDGVAQETAIVDSSGRQNTALFTGLSHGLHTLEVYATSELGGSHIESSHLNYDIIVVDGTSVTPIISINCNKNELLQGEILDIPYIVYDPLATESNIDLCIYHIQEGIYQLYRKETRTVNRALQHWSTRDYPLGDVKFTVSLRDEDRSIKVKVNENSLPISPTTNDLELYLSSANRSNSEVSPEVWTYEDISTTFTNVNWASSGWLQDPIGDTSLHLSGGTSASIGFKPFSDDLRIYGKTIEFDFAVRDVNNRDARVISCMSGDIGIEITADRATLYSALSSIEGYFHDESRLRVSFVIESRSEYRLMSLYLNGVLTSAKQYVATDNFQQTNPVDISIGSPYCAIDVYNIRSYSTALTQEEILNNYICDIADVIERNIIYDRNDLYDSSRNLLYEKVKKQIPVLTITGPLPASKGDKKDVTISYEDPEDESMNLKDLYCKIDVQGTSSQWYVRKNYKLKFKEYVTHISGAIASKVFCLKADYAEATSTHNTQNANLIHTLYSDLTPAQEVDPRCRTTVQGFPIVVYHKEDADSTPTFLGKYNYNYDKGSEEVFGFTEDFDVESWEFCNNTSEACNFTGNIPDEYNMLDENGNEIGWVNDFERRYPDNDDEMNDETISRFRIMHDWVVSTKDYDLSDSDILSQYRQEFEERFNLHKSLIYYVWTFFMLMVDQRAKNMFLTYWGETGKWEPWFYDNDTCLGINNEGQLVFDYYHEDTDFIEGGSKVYNGQDSVLWTKFSVAYAKEIKETYQELRSSGKLTYEVIHDYFVKTGSDKWSESIYNEDSDFKYISMLRSDGDATNVYQVRGTGEHHLEYFIESRLHYCDSKWYASEYADDFVNIRVNTPAPKDENGEDIVLSIQPNANITITPFSNMYAGVRYRANGTLQQARVDKNVPYTFVAPADNFSDTETAIYGASQISSLGDLAPLYCNYVNVASATKLIELKLGDEDPTYYSQLKHLSLGTNRLLKKLDIRNCSSLTDPVNLTGCPSIEEIYAEGSSISGIELADSGYLKIVHLPSTLTNLTIKNQNYIEDFSMASYENIKTINLEKSVNIPIADILLNTPLLERIRMINVEWECSEEELDNLYDKLSICGGIDETGANTSKAVVSGIVHVPKINQDLLGNINRDFPELMVSVNGVILCTVSYYNTDGTLLYVTTVERGKDAPDPVKEGIIGVPERATTLDHKYRYKGWSDTLEDIQKSRSFVATYFISYAVRFYSEDELLHIQYVDSEESADDPIISGEIETPKKESTPQYEYSFEKWDISLDYVTDVREVHAVYLETIRSYLVSFYNEDILLEQKTIEYGQLANYEGESPQKPYVTYPEDYEFLGWTPELSIVTGDIEYQANYSGSSHILDDWATVAENVSNGTYKELYPLGVLQRVSLSHVDGTTEDIEVELVGYDHDELSDGSGNAGLTFLCKTILKDLHIMSDIDSLNRASWVDSDMREYLMNTIMPALPDDLSSVILEVNKRTSAGGSSNSVEDIISTTDSIWTPSLIEIIDTYSTTALYDAEGNTYEYLIGASEEDSRNRRIRVDSEGRAQRYWTRSPVAYSSNEYWMISTLGGGISTYTSYVERGVVFGFCIGVPPKNE